MNLHQMVEEFVDKWGPDGDLRAYEQFVSELRALLEAYGKAAHESLPDTEHGHGEPV